MQKTQEIENSKNKQTRLNILHTVNIMLLFFNFILNFYGSPSLKTLYLIQAILIFTSIILYQFEQIFLEIIILFFIEGQGRILWQYEPWARIAFDIITAFAVFKIFIIKKRFFDRKTIPSPLILLISIHFLWYIIQIFNLNAVTIIGSVAATKLYVYPIFFFLAVSLSDINPDSKYFKQAITLFILLIFAEMALNYFQFTMKQNHLIGISSYYYKAMRDGIFTDKLFRPFATTALPGVIAVYLYLTVGFIYFFPSNLKTTIIKALIIGASLFTLIICQIRSAMVKYLLVIALIQFSLMFFRRFSLRSILPVFLALSLIILGGSNYSDKIFASDNEDEDVNYAIARISTLTEMKKVKNERLTPNQFGKVLINKLSQYPMGVGPGMTGAASSINQDELKGNPLIKKDLLWTSDNLIISLALDLGIGGIFFLLLIIVIPLYFIKSLLKMYRDKDTDHYRYLSICTCTIIVILIGNWGAVGLTYNPESFVYWFFSALGFKVIRIAKNAKTIST